MDAEIVIGSVLIGASLGLMVWAGSGYYFVGLEFIERDLREKLRRLRVGTSRLRTWLVVWTIFLAIVMFGFWLVLDSPVFGTTFTLIFAAAPWYVIRRMDEERRVKIEDQLADAMVSLAQAIKAGLSLGQSLEILSQQCPRPIRDEFRQMVGEYQMGKPLDKVLDETRERLRSENFALFAAAMQASRESGGKLNETVERIAHSVLELQRLERKVLSETAQARTSALYMALAPFAVLLLYYLFIDPVNTERLFVTFPGQILLSISILFNIVAYLWARRILAADI
jgi:tight adherence protein B